MTEIDAFEDTEQDTGPVNWPELDKKFSSTRRMDREQVLILTSDLIARLHSRTCINRFVEREGDRTKVSYARALIAALSTYGSLLKDEELEDLKNRLDALERAKGDSQ